MLELNHKLKFILARIFYIPDTLFLALDDDYDDFFQFELTSKDGLFAQYYSSSLIIGVGKALGIGKALGTNVFTISIEPFTNNSR